jgi:hypothetical protein
LLSGIPYHQVRAMVAKEFSITTSLAALSAFWDQVCTPALRARRRRAVSTADEMADEAQKMPGKFDAATLDAIRQAAFNLAIQPQSNPGDVKKLFLLLLKARDQELKSMDIDIKLRRLEMLERNNAAAKEKLSAAAAKGGLDKGTIEQIEQALSLL